MLDSTARESPSTDSESRQIVMMAPEYLTSSPVNIAILNENEITTKLGLKWEAGLKY